MYFVEGSYNFYVPIIACINIHASVRCGKLFFKETATANIAESIVNSCTSYLRTFFFTLVTFI